MCDRLAFFPYYFVTKELRRRKASGGRCLGGNPAPRTWGTIDRIRTVHHVSAGASARGDLIDKTPVPNGDARESDARCNTLVLLKLRLEDASGCPMLTGLGWRVAEGVKAHQVSRSRATKLPAPTPRRHRLTNRLTEISLRDPRAYFNSEWAGAHTDRKPPPR